VSVCAVSWVSRRRRRSASKSPCEGSSACCSFSDGGSRSVAYEFIVGQVRGTRGGGNEESRCRETETGTAGVRESQTGDLKVARSWLLDCLFLNFSDRSLCVEPNCTVSPTDPLITSDQISPIEIQVRMRKVHTEESRSPLIITPLSSFLFLPTSSLPLDSP
jgi:hypothetical protein